MRTASTKARTGMDIDVSWMRASAEIEPVVAERCEISACTPRVPPARAPLYRKWGQTPFPRRPRNGVRPLIPRRSGMVPRTNRGGGRAGGGEEEVERRETRRRDDGLIAACASPASNACGFDRGHERPDAAAEAGAEGRGRDRAVSRASRARAIGLGHLVARAAARRRAAIRRRCVRTRRRRRRRAPRPRRARAVSFSSRKCASRRSQIGRRERIGSPARGRSTGGVRARRGRMDGARAGSRGARPSPRATSAGFPRRAATRGCSAPARSLSSARRSRCSRSRTCSRPAAAGRQGAGRDRTRSDPTCPGSEQRMAV